MPGKLPKTFREFELTRDDRDFADGADQSFHDREMEACWEICAASKDEEIKKLKWLQEALLGAAKVYILEGDYSRFKQEVDALLAPTPSTGDGEQP